jgi:hypothetical protein
MIVSVYGLGPDNIIMGLGKTPGGGALQECTVKKIEELLVKG